MIGPARRHHVSASSSTVVDADVERLNSTLTLDAVRDATPISQFSGAVVYRVHFTIGGAANAFGNVQIKFWLFPGLSGNTSWW